MHGLISWLTSQSGVSLLVALIALLGVLVATWWNNKAADTRRRADQKAADERRRADQAAEEDRRKGDNARLERERREQLQREDYTRQRRAVADCVRDIVNAAAAIDERVSEVYLEQEGSPNNASLTKAHELARFYGEVTGRLMLLDLEITQPEVREHLAIVWKQLEKDSRKLFVARDRGDKDWAAVAERTQALGVDARLRLRELIAVAREYLHEFPGEAAGTSTRSQQS